ncbi:MAG: penicillin-binding protein 2 [Alphaproteobacteria bacterium]|nr:penicillin-binding protein 2 [Alphaproteobacteria bacterium]
MNREADRAKIFTRRAALLLGGQTVAFGVLGARLYYLQVVESEKYKVLADENRISLRIIAPVRGKIVDRHGEPLALNRVNYRIVLVPEQTGDVAATLTVLANLIPVTELDRRRILREVARKRRFVPVVVKDNLSWEDVGRVAVNTQDLPGVQFEAGFTREYPKGIDLAHLVGYVAPPAESDLTGDPLLELPDFRIGRNGIERVYDLAMRGRSGTSQLEVNALGRPIRELSRAEGEAGQDVAMTIDAGLQAYCMQRLSREESAAAVVLDVQSGDILAAASWPSFDPNEFSTGIPPGVWRQLLADARGPLTNKAVAGQYAPGSTFKMVVALAGLEAGVITPDQRVSCPGHMDLGDNRFHCWKKGGHGGVDMVEGIKQSCDVYFYEVARRLGIDRIAAMAKKLGLGYVLGVDLPGERGGLIPTRAWKMGAQGKAWAQGETLVAGIGQGFVLATPLQLAVMTARIANGGYAVEPHLARDRIEGRALVPRGAGGFPSLGIPASHLAVIQKAMAGVVNDPRGTAFRARILEPAMAMGGKTGTSQVRRISAQERLTGVRKAHEVPWKERDHALFVGYGPTANPRYSCAVIVEHGGGGSAIAAPIARDILVEAQKREADRPTAGRPGARRQS